MYVCSRHFHGGKWYKILQNQSTVDVTRIISTSSARPAPFFICSPPLQQWQLRKMRLYNQLTEEDMHTCDKSWSSSHVWLLRFSTRWKQYPMVKEKKKPQAVHAIFRIRAAHLICNRDQFRTEFLEHSVFSVKCNCENTSFYLMSK